MVLAKQNHLKPLSEAIDRQMKSLRGAKSVDMKQLEALVQLERSYFDLCKQIPEWLLHIRSGADVLRAASALVTPILVTVVTVVVKKFYLNE